MLLHFLLSKGSSRSLTTFLFLQMPCTVVITGLPILSAEETTSGLKDAFNNVGTVQHTIYQIDGDHQHAGKYSRQTSNDEIPATKYTKHVDTITDIFFLSLKEDKSNINIIF